MTNLNFSGRGQRCQFPPGRSSHSVLDCSGRWFASALFATFGVMLANQPSAAEPDDKELLFYRLLTYGSESQFNPVSSFINNSLDALQIPESFDDDHFASRAETVWHHLTDPVSAIN